MSKGWLAALAAAAFAALWFLTRPKAVAPSVSAPPARYSGPPVIPNSAANGMGAMAKGGALGTDTETLAVGGGIAAGLSAFGMPLPASLVAAKVLAVPATTVLNSAADQTGVSFLQNAPPVVKGATVVGALPLVLTADAINGVGQLSNLVFGNTQYAKVDSDKGIPQLIDDTSHPIGVGGRIAGYPQIPNPAYVFPKSYPGLKLYAIEPQRDGSKSFYYVTDPKAAVQGFASPPVLA